MNCDCKRGVVRALPLGLEASRLSFPIISGAATRTRGGSSGAGDKTTVTAPAAPLRIDRSCKSGRAAALWSLSSHEYYLTPSH